MTEDGKSSAATEAVELFLRRLSEGEIDAAADQLAIQVEYSNVSLPTVHGRERVRRLAQLTLGRPGVGFEVYMHAISQFWVCGRFDLRDGEIVLWRDRFDWMNFTAATLRGLLGIVVPAIRARAPSGVRGYD